jgi:hypothetical protein
MSDKLKIEFGSAGRKMDGWICTEIDQCDIRNRLPWPDESCYHCYASHVVEHVTPHESFRFFKEVHRILCPDGLFRIVVPILGRIQNRAHAEDLIIGHGHQMVFAKSSLEGMLFAAGFDRPNIYTTSRNPHLDTHHTTIGIEKDNLESLFMEAMK